MVLAPRRHLWASVPRCWLVVHDGMVSDALHPNVSRSVPERGPLTTADGVQLDSVLVRGNPSSTTAVVLANGFTGTWRSSDTRRILRTLLPIGDVLTFDFRGHYDSGGECTMGNDEVHDIDAGVTRLRDLGYTTVATIGFSMGAAVVVRHAGLFGGVDAVVSISGPSRWYYRGTTRMRLLHFGVEQPVGRWFLRAARRVRVIQRHWDPVPPDPTELAAGIAPAPLLVVHGDADSYFPVDHAHRVHEAARHPKDLWIEPGMGHAERAVTSERARRIAGWLSRGMATLPGEPG